MADLGRATFDIGLDLRSFTAGMQKVKQSARDTGRAVDKSMSGGKGSLASLDIRANSLRNEIRLVKINSQQYKYLAKEIRKVTAESEKATRAFQGGGFARGLVRAATIAGVVGLGMALKRTTQTAIEFERASAKIELVLGKGGAQDALLFTQKVANDLGISYKALITNFGRFTAAATATNLPLKMQKDLFRALSVAAASTGSSTQQVNAMFLAVEQMAGKGVISMEELRKQLSQQLPTALGAAAQGLGVTTAELFKLVESGKMTTREFFPALIKGLTEIHGTGPKNKWTSQQIATLGNHFYELQRNIGAITLGPFKTALGGASAILEVAAKNTSTFVSALAGIGTTAAVFLVLAKATTIAAKAQAALAAAAAVVQAILHPGTLAKTAAAVAAGAGVYLLMKKQIDAATGSLGGLEKKTSDAIVAGNALNASLKQQDLERKAAIDERIAADKFTSASDINALKRQEARLAGYQKETRLIGKIAGVRNQSAISRSSTIKSLLGIEKAHAEKMAQSDADRNRIAQFYGRRIFQQTVAEFNLKGRALIIEQQAQQASLQFEHQKTAAANRRLVMEARILQLTAQAEADKSPNNDALRQKAELAKQNLNLVMQEARAQEALFTRQTQLLSIQQQVARESLGHQRLLALARQKEHASANEIGQLQGDINRLVRKSASNTGAAAVSADNFARSLRSANEERGKLSQSFKSQIKVHLNDSNTFQHIGNGIQQVATAVDKVASQPINIHISQQPGGGYSATSSGGVTGTGL